MKKTAIILLLLSVVAFTYTLTNRTPDSQQEKPQELDFIDSLIESIKLDNKRHWRVTKNPMSVLDEDGVLTEKISLWDLDALIQNKNLKLIDGRFIRSNNSQMRKTYEGLDPMLDSPDAQDLIKAKTSS